MIPTFFCIDVEPDEKGPEIGERPWTGFPATLDLVDGLRQPLAERSGVEPHFSWFFRMDPSIETCFGRVDYVMHRHGDVVERLVAAQEYLGIHVHPHRWDDEHGYLYSDHSDVEWGTHCVNVAAETFERSFGERLRRARMGGRFVPEFVIDALVANGAEVDLTVEPGLPGLIDDDSLGHHATEPSPDFAGFPTYPYRVSRSDLSQPATCDEDSRPLVEIPMTAYDYETELLPFRRRVKRKLRGHRSVMPMNMWEPWQSPKTYWDLVAKAIDRSPVSYFAFRDAKHAREQGLNATVREVLGYLPQHPLSKRLAFVDPLTMADLPVGAHRA